MGFRNGTIKTERHEIVDSLLVALAHKNCYSCSSEGVYRKEKYYPMELCSCVKIRIDMIPEIPPLEPEPVIAVVPYVRKSPASQMAEEILAYDALVERMNKQTTNRNGDGR